MDAGFRVQGQTFGVRESRWSQQCRDKMARVSPVSEFTPFPSCLCQFASPLKISHRYMAYSLCRGCVDEVS